MDKLEIIKMELDDCLDLDCDIQMILDEGYGEVSSAIYSAHNAMSKAVDVDKEVYEKYKELSSDPNLERSIKLVILQSLKDRLDAHYAKMIDNREAPIAKYDDFGNLIYFKDPDGYEFWKEYDSKNRLIRFKDSKGYDFQKEYDLKPKKVVIKNPK